MNWREIYRKDLKNVDVWGELARYEVSIGPGIKEAGVGLISNAVTPARKSPEIMLPTPLELCGELGRIRVKFLSGF